MIYQNNIVKSLLIIMLIMNICSCDSRIKYTIQVYGAFYPQETLFVEIEDKPLFQKTFTQKPMEMCNDSLVYDYTSNPVKIHVFTKYMNSIKVDTTFYIKKKDVKPKFHLLFSIPFVKKGSKIIDSEQTPPIESSLRIVNLTEEDPNWNDIRK